MWSAAEHHRDLKRLVLASLLVAAVVIAGMVGVVAFAARAIDRHELQKEQSLVQRRLDRKLENLVEDVNSATIWNDTVVATGARWDAEWLQANLGDYYADYMQHAVTLIYDGDGRLRMASRDSEPVPLAREAALAAAAAPIVAQVRAESMTPGKRAARGFDAVVNRSAVVRVGADIYLIAVSTVVPDTEAVARPARDAVVVTAGTMTSLLETLPGDLAIQAPKLAPATATTAASVPITTPGQAEALGRIVWTPERPGGRLLRDAAPLAGVVLLLLAAAGVGLFLAVGRVARRLSETQAALATERDRAEAANEAKTRFLANMSHELRTPLNGVMGMAEVMAVGELSAIQRSHLAILRSSAGDLLRLIERLLQVTRLDKGDVGLVQAPFEVRDLVESAVADHSEQAEKKGLRLTADVRMAGPRLGDPDHLKQVLGHLLDNALTYTTHGAVLVEAESEGDLVHIRVIDTGPGIPEDKLACLFDRFVQVDDSATRRFDGAGLGLAICRDLVKAMGGTLSVDTSPEGSVFTVAAPLPPQGPKKRDDSRIAA